MQTVTLDSPSSVISLYQFVERPLMLRMDTRYMRVREGVSQEGVVGRMSREEEEEVCADFKKNKD